MKKRSAAVLATASSSAASASGKKARSVSASFGRGWADVRANESLSDCKPGPESTVLKTNAALPTRQADGTLLFADRPDFRPNLTPREVIEQGAFGGGYFRPIHSNVTGQDHVDAHLEFPDAFGELDAGLLTRAVYDETVNKYGVKCGGSLAMWQSSAWISVQDPYGWFQWFTRFFFGRRSTDDDRQVQRFNACAGEKGRWRANLITKIRNAGAAVDDPSVAPVVRQTLHHWGYRLTQAHFDAKK